jgi:hypothetical protein
MEMLLEFVNENPTFFKHLIVGIAGDKLLFP